MEDKKEIKEGLPREERPVIERIKERVEEFRKGPVPEKPTGLDYEVEDNNIILEWNKNPEEDEVIRYLLYVYDKDKEEYIKFSQTLYDVVSYELTAEPGDYIFAVSAVNEARESERSTDVNVSI